MTSIMCMTMITLEAIQSDIDRAVQNNSSRCVIAQAIVRSIPTAKRVEVDMQTIRWTQDGERIVYITPYAVQDYLIAFDAGDKIEPFKFKLNREQRMTSPLMKRNAAALKVMAADNKVRDRKKRVQTLEAKVETAKRERKPVSEVKPLQAKVREAKASVVQAEQEKVTVLKTEGPKAVEKADNANTDRKRPVKRVGTTSRRTNKRYYGRRLMRVNQEDHAAVVDAANERIRTHRAPRKQAAPAKKTAAAPAKKS